MKRNSCLQYPFDLIGRYRAAIMGTAALLILFFHNWIRMNLQVWCLAEIENSILSVCYIGVEIFLFLSGMGLTYAIEKYPSVWQFYKMRIRRIAFPFVFAGILYACTYEWSIQRFLLTVSCVVHVAESVQAFLWYVPAAMILYAVFPLFYRLLVHSENETAFVLNFIGIWMILCVAFRNAIRDDLWMFLNRIPVFVCGILAGRLSQTRRVEFRRVHWCGVLIAMMLGFQLTRMAIKGQFILLPEVRYSLQAAILGISIVFLLSALFRKMENCEGIAGEGMRRGLRGLSYIGSFSLELYCVHEWLFSVLYGFLEGKLTYLQINCVVIPASLFAGWLVFGIHKAFWMCFDRIPTWK